MNSLRVLRNVGEGDGPIILLPRDFPEIVCLCGSTKFVKEFNTMMMNFTLRGKIVLTIGSHDPEEARKYADGFDGRKKHLDGIHKRKIDLADKIFVINVGGYIGESTRSEIAYALDRGKTVTFLERMP